MSKLKKTGLVASILLTIILAGAFGYIRHIATKGIPDYDGEIMLNGLSGEVTVYRDEFAVPHIYAKTEKDLYMAVGYCMAQDRLFQMDLIRRVTSGRLSEVVGEKAVGVDHLMRALRIPEKSRLIMSKSDTVLLEAMEAFSSGVNQYISSHEDKLPVEFTILGYVPEKWKPVHSFNVVGYMAFDLSTGWKTELLFHKILEKVGEKSMQEILPDIRNYREVIYPEFAKQNVDSLPGKTLLSSTRMLGQMGLTVFNGSNNWVVSGEKSTTGKPILANDMHLGLNSPGIWYQMHHVVESEGINSTGVVVPGQPLITAGHTNKIAWGFTNVMVDDMDFYLEKINPDNPDEYEFNGKWRKMKVRKEKIEIKGGKVVEKKIQFTHRGPVISDLKHLSGTSISMHWTGNEYSNESRTLYLLRKAENWDDFKNAVKTFKAVSQNIVYADVKGNIGLYCSAGVPLREKGAGVSIMPGWTDKYDWKGFVPFEALPHSYNPENGYLCSANNKTVDEDYPYYISTWFVPDHRFRRINEMLASQKRFSVDDFKRMQGDWKSKLVEDMRPEIVDVVKNTGDLSPLEKTCLGILESWDGVMAKESSAAALFETFYVSFMDNIFRDELGDELFQEFIAMGYVTNFAVERMWADRSSAWYDNVGSTDRSEDFSEAVRKSFRDAALSLVDKMGDDPEKWQWGKIHQLTLAHPLGGVKALDLIFGLNRGPFPTGGSSHTVSPYQYKYSKPFNVYHGASHRHIYSLADWNDSVTVIPTGTCGVPASPYYCDQTQRYLANRYHHDFVDKELVEKSARHVMTLTGK
jgi:penicillin G amidase